MFETLYQYYLNALEKGDKTVSIYSIFLNDMSPDYINDTSNKRIVIDYISGMTDEFFTKEFHSIK